MSNLLQLRPSAERSISALATLKKLCPQLLYEHMQTQMHV